MDQKWRTVSSDVLIKDQWIDVRADSCVTPTGTKISPYYVLTYPDWVHVVAVTTDGCLVLVRQYRHAVGDMFLELPGGVIENSDLSIKQAAQRELEEETGFTAKCWMPISSLYANPAMQTNRVHAYLALDAICNCEQALDQEEEGLQVCLVPIKDVLDGLGKGLLGQAMHVSAVLLGLALAGRLTIVSTEHCNHHLKQTPDGQ